MRYAITVLLAITIISASSVLPPGISTQPGEWRDVTLEDGSVAALGPRTTIVQKFNGKRRVVRLLGGEAVFKVLKDPFRPFIVETSHACAQALGTTYGVSWEPHRTIVTTVEGTVAVSRRDHGDGQAAETETASKGQQVVVESWTPLIARDVNIDDELAWVQKKVAVGGKTIEQVIREFNRRNRTQIPLPNHPGVATARMHGYVRIDDPEQFARFVDDQLNRRKPRK